ncbi:MAG: M1 family peptidase, partial [Bacteroidota bacterium]|nr:M1 family peptidase [Bacteroidota bacterium]
MRIVAKLIALVLLFILTVSAFAQKTSSWQGKFEQLDALLPTPNAYRTGSGAPGAAYWQQRADYVIEAKVNDKTQELTGHETITYHNNAPEALRFLWLQLDQNIFAPENLTSQTQTGEVV